MSTRFVLGPAGSGKTFRCLSEIRATLENSADEMPLVLLAPKQSTYMLERALLSSGELGGYSRLHVLSFERLAEMVFEQLGMPIPELLSEEGRLMVLRSILSRRQDDLQLFRASARLTGFGNELASVLDELQRNEVTPELLKTAAEKAKQNKALSLKLHDIATIFADYQEWLREHSLRDANVLLTTAACALEKAEPATKHLFAALWADGFADLSLQECSFLAAVAKRCRTATLTFCLHGPPTSATSWLSNWAVPGKSLERCKKAFVRAGLAAPGCDLVDQGADNSRFSESAVLGHIERHWAARCPYPGPVALCARLRVLSCADPEAEVREAAREIRRYVCAGGRYRDITVLARQLDPYHAFIKRIFAQFEIPVFMDRREDVSHHPLAELTRSALRTVASDWNPEDWFSTLKTGLAPLDDPDIDRLENEALARNWRGKFWAEMVVEGDANLSDWLAKIGRKMMPPFKSFCKALGKKANGISGKEVSEAIRTLWKDLKVEENLQKWTESNNQGSLSGEAHMTVWRQVNAWLEDVDLAFARDRMPLHDWLPILEAGLSRLTVGLIPPALDQVLVGNIERSRNCEAKLAIVLGVNESLFPARPSRSALLTDNDREALEKLELAPAENARQHMSRERHLAYLAFTRASQRLVIAFSAHDSQGAITNPSPFLSHIKQLFPTLEIETVPTAPTWQEAEHAHEIVQPALEHHRLQTQAAGALGTPQNGNGHLPKALLRLQSVAEALETVKAMEHGLTTAVPPELVVKIYGRTLNTSVSRLEQFAACPFRFFVESGLGAKERSIFELDAREKGSFQHEILAQFHEALRAKGKRWRDITPIEARKLVAQIADQEAGTYRDGLLQTSEQTRFTALLMRESLQDFVETMVEWMRSQYMFDPVAAEFNFDEGQPCPPWELDLGSGNTLRLRGRIDRVDLQKAPEAGSAYCVVTDYKSGQKKLNDLLIEHGLQLQLISYLNVLTNVKEAAQALGVSKIVPAGVFYVRIQGGSSSKKNRVEALEGTSEARRESYKHSGRFDLSCLNLLDSREPKESGNQFSYRINKNGSIAANCTDPMPSQAFNRLLSKVQATLVKMGKRIFNGDAGVEPYRRGNQTACEHCQYRCICRSDPWTQMFRVLTREAEEQS